MSRTPAYLIHTRWAIAELSFTRRLVQEEQHIAYAALIAHELNSRGHTLGKRLCESEKLIFTSVGKAKSVEAHLSTKFWLSKILETTPRKIQLEDRSRQNEQNDPKRLLQVLKGVTPANGKIALFCYGWLTVDGATEDLLGRKFECFPILWDKHFSDDPDGNPPVRGILLEYIRGRTLDQIESISEELADQFRHSLQMIQDAGIHHADVKELNLKVEKGEKRAIWLDFSVSETLPLPPRLCFRPAAQTRDGDLLNDLLQKKMLKEM
ncbi:hypothetical protein RUND412_011108 [Rhizina undulata]